MFCAGNSIVVKQTKQIAGCSPFSQLAYKQFRHNQEEQEGLLLLIGGEHPFKSETTCRSDRTLLSDILNVPRAEGLLQMERKGPHQLLHQSACKCCAVTKKCGLQAQVTTSLEP